MGQDDARLSTRNYGAVVKDFQDAYGIEKSAVSENFIEASREKVKELNQAIRHSDRLGRQFQECGRRPCCLRVA